MSPCPTMQIPDKTDQELSMTLAQAGTQDTPSPLLRKHHIHSSVHATHDQILNYTPLLGSDVQLIRWMMGYPSHLPLLVTPHASTKRMELHQLGVHDKLWM